MLSRSAFFPRSVYAIVILAILLTVFLAASAFSQNVLTYHNNNSRTGLNHAETTAHPQQRELSTPSASCSPLKSTAPSTPSLSIFPQFQSTARPTTCSSSPPRTTPSTHSTPIPAPNSGRSGLSSPVNAPSDDHGCSQITPEIGITSTPVINRPAGTNGVIYTVAMSKDSSGNYHQRLHALDATTGNELYGGPVNIAAKYPGTGDNSSGGYVIFDPGQYAERAALLLTDGNVYLSWTSHCDARPYTGWVMAYNATTLKQKTVINLTPNGSEGSIWGAGSGLTTDNNGNIFFLDANGIFDTTLNSSGFPEDHDYGNAFLRLTTSSGLAVADYFEMYNGPTKVKMIPTSAPAVPFFCPT